MATKNRLIGYRPDAKERIMVELMATEYGMPMSQVIGMAVRKEFIKSGLSLPTEPDVSQQLPLPDTIVEPTPVKSYRVDEVNGINFG